MSVEEFAFPNEGASPESDEAREHRYPNYERQLESIKPVIESIQSLYEAAGDMESSYRNALRYFLSGMEVALKHEAAFLQDPEQYRRWHEEINPIAYPDRGQLDPTARKYLAKAVAELKLGGADRPEA